MGIWMSLPYLVVCSTQHNISDLKKNPLELKPRTKRSAQKI
jgi:hypothetical protein